jgi:threonine synthase
MTGWRCAVCGARREIAEPFPWRCRRATATDRHHVLHIVPAEPVAPAGGRPAEPPDRPSLLTHDGDLAWAAYAAANGMTLDQRTRLVTDLEAAVVAVGGVGFAPTPFGRSDVLSRRLGFADPGGIWVKDESGGVAGSHKARHLVTILLHLLAAENLGHLPERPPLAIASCGNAALAAATLARAAGWPLDVFVPEWMSDEVGERIGALGATIHRCPRRTGDPPGDPAMLRCREAVQAGAIPFTVQGPENALCLDGGRTLGWEVADGLAAAGVGGADRVFAQVGGGAFAACLGRGLGEGGVRAALHAVQAAGCAPLARAWERAGGRPAAEVARRWSELMTPWDRPTSAADGILDDETYDWLAVFEAMQETGGAPVVAPEALIVEAHRLAHDAGYEVSATGAAGLAGLLAVADRVDPTERVVVVMTGIAH